MSDAKVYEKKIGVIASSEFVSESKNGWKRFDVAFETGETFRGVIPDDVDHEIKAGQELTFKKGRWNTWILDSDAIGGGGTNGASESSSSAAPKKRVKDGTGKKWTNNDYWKGKFFYETDYKDPRLEFQGFGNHTGNLYAAMVSNAGKPIHEMDDDEFNAWCEATDSVVDSFFAKTKELFRRVNKHDPHGEESDK